MVCFRFALGAKHKENNTVKLKATRLFRAGPPGEGGLPMVGCRGGGGEEGSTQTRCLFVLTAYARIGKIVWLQKEYKEIR